MKSLNIVHGITTAPIPVPDVKPMDLKETGSLKLLDELAEASQWQLVGPTSELRQAWRARMYECHAELLKRTVKVDA